MSPSSHLRLVTSTAGGPVDGDLREARRAQDDWARLPVRRRLDVIRETRHRIAENAELLVEAVSDDPRLRQRSRIETLSSEVLPLAEACRFLEREAGSLLRPRSLGRRGRPVWLWGSEVEIRREPWGVILILGPANYPLLLPGVQLLQALTAGNGVLVKPGDGGARSAALLVELLLQSGMPAGLAQVLDASRETGARAVASDVDKVVLTGSLATGRTVLTELASTVTPATMELSGCDPVFVLEDADLDLVVRGLSFGLRWNGSFTCIAPRRLFVVRRRAAELERRLAGALDSPPIAIGFETARQVRSLVETTVADGARIAVGELPQAGWMRPIVLTGVTPRMALLQADVAAPVLALTVVDSEEEALTLARQCPYELGATVFGDPDAAGDLARRVPAGVVTINDLIVPTADPRVPFGGRRASGFGVTRGAEGLLELTRVKAILRRRGRFRPHFEPAGPGEERLLSAFLQISHARKLTSRARALFELLKSLIRRPRKAETPR